MCGGVAGHVDDAGRAEVEELIEEWFVAALAWRVDDDGGLGGIKGNVIENCFRSAFEELGVLDVVLLGIVSGPLDGEFADFDAFDLLKTFCCGEGKEAGAAVGIDEKLGVILRGLGGDVASESGEDGGVILEELAGDKFEGDLADLFAGELFWIGDDIVPREAE